MVKTKTEIPFACGTLELSVESRGKHIDESPTIQLLFTDEDGGKQVTRMSPMELYRRCFHLPLKDTA